MRRCIALNGSRIGLLNREVDRAGRYWPRSMTHSRRHSQQLAFLQIDGPIIEVDSKGNNSPTIAYFAQVVDEIRYFSDANPRT